MDLIFTGGTIVLEDRLLTNACVRVAGGRIQAIEFRFDSDQGDFQRCVPRRTFDSGFVSVDAVKRIPRLLA